MNWLFRLIAIVGGYFLGGVIAGRVFWAFIEEKIDAEVFRSNVNAIGQSVGLEEIKSIDSRLAAIEKIVDFLSFPWALACALLMLLIVDCWIRWAGRKRVGQ